MYPSLDLANTIGKIAAEEQTELIEVVEKNIAYGEKVANHIIKWYSEDNYNQTRSYPKYTVQRDNEKTWNPTPPDYISITPPHPTHDCVSWARRVV